MVWTKLRNLPCASLGIFTSCILGACKLPILLPQIVCFFNPCFLQCIPVRSVSCKCFVSDHPALHKGLVERKSIQARNVLTIHC